jgi:hypothetical protein
MTMDLQTALAWAPTLGHAGVTAIMGLGLAATCGLRAFLPLLAVNVLALTGMVELDGPFVFMGTWQATLMFGLATIAELSADKFPGVDHFMDAFGTVARPTAAAVAASSMVAWYDPLAAVALGLIGGATVAGGVQLVKAKVRLATSALTAGTGNWAVSLTEDAAAIGTIALAVAAPLLFGAVASTALALVAILFAMRHQRKELALVRARAAAA